MAKLREVMNPDLINWFKKAKNIFQSKELQEIKDLLKNDFSINDSKNLIPNFPLIHKFLVEMTKFKFDSININNGNNKTLEYINKGKLELTQSFLNKFRTMKTSTPKDVPTHLLENPDQYITRVGRVLRKYSLDELPQIINILRGDLLWIGPRPALYNQNDLIKLREEYNINILTPGITGWAQVNGRDEISIPEKVSYDWYYKKNLCRNSISGIIMDIRCLLKTVGVVLSSEGNRDK